MKYIFIILVIFSNSIASANDVKFNEWLIKFKRQALKSGISEKTYNLSMSKVIYLPKVIKYDRFQPEFYENTKTYISKRTSKKKLSKGIEIYKSNKDFITFVTDDSLNFLSKFNKGIDFLYLDSLDGQFEGASSHQLKEIMIAKKNLKENSLVLLDDKGDKTNLSIDYMLKNNFKIINETKQQVLLSYQ